DLDGGLAVKESRYGRALDGAGSGGECDVGASDLQGCWAAGVAENDADAGAAAGDVDDLTQGSVVGEAAVGVGGGDRRAGPGADPMGIGVGTGGGGGGSDEGN